MDAGRDLHGVLDLESLLQVLGVLHEPKEQHPAPLEDVEDAGHVVELLARIRVALRHAAQTMGSQKSQIITVGQVVIDLALHMVTRAGEEVKLTATEFKLLAYLAANAGRVITNQSILSHVWDPADADHVEYLRVFVRQLRKKLEDDPEQPRHILNEPGIGYRFIIDE